MSRSEFKYWHFQPRKYSFEESQVQGREKDFDKIEKTVEEILPKLQNMIGRLDKYAKDMDKTGEDRYWGNQKATANFYRDCIDGHDDLWITIDHDDGENKKEYYYPSITFKLPYPQKQQWKKVPVLTLHSAEGTIDEILRLIGIIVDEWSNFKYQEMS